ncbi:uncharacterized protein LOC132281306 [Cornus florida]|uniref:uncharacterized protein LOC132281306 n=1 Tax=Cornus florida TaxID=4283 RepID=UPI00289D870C|nr:uncharacterized protein LOC132281306 [Cornus florida]
MAISPIALMLPHKTSVWNAITQLVMKEPASESKHFLDLAHNIYLPLFGKDSNSNRTSVSNSSGHEICTRMPSVTELQEASIRFNADESEDVSIFDITFKHGHLKIPIFKVTDDTERFLRNIVAYEQHSSSVELKYFTDYRSIMDSLINTEKDVNILRLRGIMENWLGDDEEVARMFNKLGDGVMINPPTFYYSQVCQKVKNHCRKPWNRAKAKLRRTYFHNPWASISTAAAGVLLLLTLIQTVVALISQFA